ncbi:hypothetical protein D3C77_399970 [compost metagenome]
MSCSFLRIVFHYFKAKFRKLCLQKVGNLPFVLRLAVDLHQLYKLSDDSVFVDHWTFLAFYFALILMRVYFLKELFNL